MEGFYDHPRKLIIHVVRPENLVYNSYIFSGLININIVRKVVSTCMYMTNLDLIKHIPILMPCSGRHSPKI